MVHKDLAASVQKIYEHIFFQILKTINLFTESSNLCLSGGCAYNGSANGKITKNSPFIVRLIKSLVKNERVNFIFQND